MQFIEEHRKELANKYKKFESFNEKFVIDDNMLDTLREMGEKEGEVQWRTISESTPTYQNAAQSTDCPRPLGHDRIFPGNEHNERKCTKGFGNTEFGRIREEVEINKNFFSPI